MYGKTAPKRTIKTALPIYARRLLLKRLGSIIGGTVLIYLMISFLPVLQEWFSSSPPAKPVSQIIKSPSKTPVDTVSKPTPPAKDTTPIIDSKPTKQSKPKGRSYYSIKSSVSEYIEYTPYSESENKRLEKIVKRSGFNKKRREELTSLLERHKKYRIRYSQYQTGLDVSAFNGDGLLC